MKHLSKLVVGALFAAIVVGANVPGVVAQQEDQYVLPAQEIQDIFGADKNYSVLDNLGPDGLHFLVPLYTELSTLERLAETTYRLATLQIRPSTDRLWHLDTFGIYGLRIYSLENEAFHDIRLPEGIFVSDMTWSPAGDKIAFLAHLADGTQVWTADIATGEAGPLSKARVLATIATRSQLANPTSSRMIQWTPDGTVITLLVPADRGVEPLRNPVPPSPMIRRTLDEATVTRTVPYLLRDEHDTALFTYYTTSQIAELAPGREPRPIGERGMYTSILLSPDGRHLLSQKIEGPFSYITGYNGFAQKTQVMNMRGTVMNTLVERELRESGGGRGGGDGNADQPRELAWRADGAGLSYLQRAPRQPDSASEDESAPRADRIMLLAAPFNLDDAEEVVESPDPLSGVSYSLDGGQAFAGVSRDGRRGLAHFDLSAADPTPHMLVDFHDTDDPAELPGDLWTTRTSNGLTYAHVRGEGVSAFMQGAGYKEDFRPQPFVDRVRLADGNTERIFEGSTTSFDRPLVLLDADAEIMIVSRESKTDFPDSYTWAPPNAVAGEVIVASPGFNSILATTKQDADAGYGDNLTNNVDPFPAITAARRVDFEFTRRDGLEIQGRISLPVGYREGERVPAVFWTYPREYTSAEAYRNAVTRARNHNAFTHMSWLRWSDMWLTQGYALVYPDIPIIGDPYNDVFIADMRDSMYAAIRAVDRMGYVDIDRVGHGGHSYGAFTTANVLAHAPFFKAGIAGDGAYNRSLTPGGFQSERRTSWEAPHIYLEIAPFFSADQIDVPLLMYHGGADNNSGTWPIQSERMIQALTTLGKTAVLYMYPFESYTPRAIENNLDMWARWIEWFDKHVKGEDDELTSHGQR